MAVTTAVLRAACNTATGNQDFTTTDFGGGTPVSCLVFTTGGLVDGTEAEYLCMLASSDGTNGASATSSCADNVSTTNTRRTRSDSGIAFIDPSGTADGYGTISMITNGIRVNWTTAPGSAYLLTVVLLGGADLSAHHYTFPSLILNNATATATPSFQAHLIFAGQSDSTTYTLTYSDAVIAQGVYDYNGGGTARLGSMAASSNDNSSTSITGAQYDNANLLAWPNPNTGAANHYIGLDAITSTTYTIRNSSGSSVRSGWSQAINVGAKGYKAWAESTPTTTGNWSVTGVGFKPQLVIGYLGFLVTNGVFISSVHAGVHAISVFTPDAEFCNAGMLEDGASSAIRSKGLSDNQAVNMPESDGTTGFAGTFVSMDSDGFTLNLSATDASARTWTFIAIEEEGAAGDTSNLTQGTETVVGYVPSATHTQNVMTTLTQGTATATTFVPTVTLTQGDESILAQGSATATGFAPTVVTTENIQSTLAQGVATSAGFDPTVTLTQDILSSLEAGAATSTGFAPTVTLLEGDQTTLAQGTATTAGFDPTITLTQNVRSDLVQGAAVATGAEPTAGLAQNVRSNLPQGASTATGFDLTTTLLEGSQTILAQGAATSSGFEPTVTVTQNIRSSLEQGASTLTGFDLTVTVGAGEISNLEAGAAAVAGFDPSVSLTQDHVSTLTQGSFALTGLAPAVEVTGIVAPTRVRRGGAGGGKKRKHYRRIMIAGIVYQVASPEEELALWKAHLMRVREEKAGRLGEIEARSVERKIKIVEKRAAAAKPAPRKKEALLVQYVAARRKIVRSKIQELLKSLG